MIYQAPPPNPFPGLRPFGLEEALLFFGRDADVNELLARLHDRRIVLVAGQPGSGRVSVVRAGLLPALEPMEWRVSHFRPGLHPVQNLAQAICLAMRGVDPKPVEQELRASSFGLMSPTFRDATPHLFIVDQLEEIFRFGSQVTEAEIAEFLNLLSTAAAQHKPATYVLFVVRADFLGECTRWLRLTEAMNAGGLYLLPRLKRDRLREVITAPINFAGAQITPSLVQRILNEATDDPNVLPSLQYTLRRTWEVWSRSGVPKVPIDHEHYEAAGGMTESLNHGADEAFYTLSENQRRIAAHMFQALVSVSEQETVRRAATVHEVAAITAAPVNDLVEIISYFVAPERAFLSASFEAMTADTIVNIGHEILLYRWNRLRRWIADERKSVKMLTRLGRLGEYDAPLSASDIQDANQWLENTRPTEAWAAKYGFSLASVTRFLALQARASRLKRWRRILLVALILGVFVALVSLFVYSR